MDLGVWVSVKVRQESLEILLVGQRRFVPNHLEPFQLAGWVCGQNPVFNGDTKDLVQDEQGSVEGPTLDLLLVADRPIHAGLRGDPTALDRLQFGPDRVQGIDALPVKLDAPWFPTCGLQLVDADLHCLREG